MSHLVTEKKFKYTFLFAKAEQTYTAGLHANLFYSNFFCLSFFRENFFFFQATPKDLDIKPGKMISDDMDGLFYK